MSHTGSRVVVALLLLCGLTLAAEAQPAGLQIKEVSYSGNVLKITLHTVGTTLADPANADNGIAVVWDRDPPGQVSDPPAFCDGPNWVGGATGSEQKWEYSAKINASWRGRIKFQQKVNGNPYGGEVSVYLSAHLKVVRAEQGSAANPTVINVLSMTPGDSETLVLRVRNIVTDELDTSVNSTFCLEITGPENGAACFTFDNGHLSKKVTFQNGVAEVTVMCYSGATRAYLLGFDAEKSMTDETSLGGLRVILVSE